MDVQVVGLMKSNYYRRENGNEACTVYSLLFART